MILSRPLLDTKELICYCFSYTAQDIQEDFHKHGYSTILEFLKKAKQQQQCQCATTSPTGR